MNDMRDRILRHVNHGELPYRTRGEHHTRLEARLQMSFHAWNAAMGGAFPAGTAAEPS